MIPEWLSSALEDPSVTDICLNGAYDCYIDRGAGMERQTSLQGSWSEEHLKSWILEQLSAAGKSWDAKHPFVDATTASGHRLHVAFPPIARQGGLLVSIRRLPRPCRTQLSGPAEFPHRWGSSALYSHLARAVRQRETVLVCGATGSGKTTLINDLLSQVDAAERMIALEDTPELSPDHPHFISLTSRPANADGFGEVSLRALLRQTLRMRPDRIVLGECRGDEVLDLLQCLNTGHQGTLTTLHANSPRDALRRIELLCLLASGGRIAAPVIRELLATGIQWIAQLRRSGRVRAISEVCKVEGLEGNIVLLRPLGAESEPSSMILDSREPWRQ